MNFSKSSSRHSVVMLKPPKWGRRRQERLSRGNHSLARHSRRSRCRGTPSESAAWREAETRTAWPSLIRTSPSPTSPSLYLTRSQFWSVIWATSRQLSKKALENTTPVCKSHATRQAAALPGVEPNFNVVVTACTNKMKTSWIEQSQEATKRTLRKSNL